MQTSHQLDRNWERVFSLFTYSPWSAGLGSRLLIVGVGLHGKAEVCKDQGAVLGHEGVIGLEVSLYGAYPVDALLCHEDACTAELRRLSGNASYASISVVSSPPPTVSWSRAHTHKPRHCKSPGISFALVWRWGSGTWCFNESTLCVLVCSEER